MAFQLCGNCWHINSLSVQNLSWMSWNLQNAGTSIRCSIISRNVLLMLPHYSSIRHSSLDLYKLHMPVLISQRWACLKTQLSSDIFFPHVTGLFLHFMMLSSTARATKNKMNSLSYFNWFNCWTHPLERAREALFNRVAAWLQCWLFILSREGSFIVHRFNWIFCRQHH